MIMRSMSSPCIAKVATFAKHSDGNSVCGYRARKILIRIKGSKAVLERAVLASRTGPPPGSQMSARWRAIQNKTSNSYTFELAK